MSRLHTALPRRRELRARLREDRFIRRVIAAAPTRQSAHELATLALRR